MRLQLDRLPSPLGELLIITDESGLLRALDFEDYGPRMHRLLQRHYGRPELQDHPAPATVRSALLQYFDGDLAAIDALPTATGGTPFQRQVWTALRDIRAGRPSSYGELANLIGRSGASRAVGLANGANPIAIVVPCHRVIGAGGALTGYGGGLWRKRWLLDHELRQPASRSAR